MYPRLFTPPFNKSFFLFGPRGTGKTTWIKQNLPESAVLNLLDDELYRRLLARPESLLDWVPKQQRSKPIMPIVIDEVQKIPALLNEVHRLIEDEKLVFVLTGSSARKLNRGAANLLAGRAYRYEMFPLTSVETQKDFDLKRALQYGMLPAINKEPNPKAFLSTYVSTYLKEEIQQEGLTRNLAGFARFLEAASFSQAQPLVVSNVAQDCQIERKVVEDYFSILEDLMIGVRLPVFAKRAKRELYSKNKFYFFDVGVFQSIRPKGPLDFTEELQGAALETLVFQELRALNSYLDWGYELFYWRTKSKHEVDLILYGEKGLHAIEVKSSSRVRKEDLTGLKLFASDYPTASLTLVYLGTKQYVESDIRVIPATDFFRDTKTLFASG
ncbi:ATP-binding protein [Bdellovibrionota bacterium FG-2]